MTRVLMSFTAAVSMAMALSLPLGAASAQTEAGIAPPTYDGLNRLGATLPSSSGSQGEPEPLNSVPPGALNGTPAMQRHLALQAYRAQQWQAGQAHAVQ